jgi:fumarate hydratase class II
MVAAEVIGNDATITIAGQSGNFQLNVMLPVISMELFAGKHSPAGQRVPATGR